MAIHKEIVLNKKQKEALDGAERYCKKAKLLKRILCIKMRSEKKKYSEISKTLKISNESIRLRITTYITGGLDELLGWNYKGKPHFLNEDQLEQIRDQNKKTPFGTAKEAMDYIETEFGIKFHLHHVQKLLKKNFAYLSKNQRNYQENIHQ